MDRPEIVYPCTWPFQIIATDAAHARERVAAIVGSRPHALTASRRSAKGTYVSLRLELEVVDEADRNGLFVALRAVEGVKLVL